MQPKAARRPGNEATVQELGRKRGGGRIFEGGVLAGHYGTSSSSPYMTVAVLIAGAVCVV